MRRWGATLGALFLTSCRLANGDVQEANQPTGGPLVCTQAPLVGNHQCDLLYGGVSEVDITPPPGLPTYGAGSNGAKAAVGYWLKLKARIIVLDAGPQRQVLIQTDLGASSSLVHRKLAEALAGQHVSPENLMLVATHTHGGPGGFSGDKFYNRMVSAKPAFNKGYTDYLVDELKKGVLEALADMQPAKLGFAEHFVDSRAMHNRSLEAWRKNYLDNGQLADEHKSVDNKVTVLRVDLQRGQAFVPAALFATFGVHGTAMNVNFPLYHGDVHGYAARLVAHSVNTAHGDHGFVAAVAAGAEGDVSPGPLGARTGKELVAFTATMGANAILAGFEQAGLAMHGPENVQLAVAYEEVSLRGASSSLGPLCDEAILGGPQAAGSEVSRGPTFGFFEMVEGVTREPDGCQSRKVKAGGAIQDEFFSPEEFPDVVPFQAFRFRFSPATGAEEAHLLLGFPGEPTTEVGREVVRRAKVAYRGSGKNLLKELESVAVVGLANGYATYFTTPSEYMAQHYEGGATLYGPYQGVFAAERLAVLARETTGLIEEVPGAPPRYQPHREFQPGLDNASLWPSSAACKPSSWTAEGLSIANGMVRFQWRGIDEQETCQLPAVSVECHPVGKRPGKQPRPLRAEPGLMPITDEGFQFEVWREGSNEWSASWSINASSKDPCYIVVRHPEREEPLMSESFAAGNQ